MKFKNAVLVFICFFATTYPLLSYSPYDYNLRVVLWKEIDKNLKVEFLVNSDRKNGVIDYGEGENSFLDLFFTHGYNPDTTYQKFFIMKRSSAGNSFFDVNHTSRAFLELDAISQLLHLFEEIKLIIDGQTYRMVIEKLNEGVLDLYVREDHPKHSEHTRIAIYITEEFLDTYCVLEDEDIREESVGIEIVEGRPIEESGYQKLMAPIGDRNADDRFGNSVSVDGGYALVGAQRDEERGPLSGAAYVFKRSRAGGWIQEAKLMASDGDWGDNFGYSVSLNGGYALIGAPYDDNKKGSSAGAAYVFKRDSRGNWAQEAKLTASDGDRWDDFGFSVSLNGGYAMIGAPSDDNRKGRSAGAVYVFKRNSKGNWIKESKLIVSDGNRADFFGYSVSLDGVNALVGARGGDNNEGTSTGVAYVFQRKSRGKRNSRGKWIQEAKLMASDGAEQDDFGYSVSLDGSRALVGAIRQISHMGPFAGAVYVFQRNSGGNWTQEAKLSPNETVGAYSGYSMSLDGDYALVGVGAYSDDDKGTSAGAAYVYHRDSRGNWLQKTKLTAPDGDEYDHFGYSVSLDGDYAIIGAFYDEDGKKNGTGSAYFYDIAYYRNNHPVRK